MDRPRSAILISKDNMFHKRNACLVHNDVDMNIRVGKGGGCLF
jgi:hypothetical protein